MRRNSACSFIFSAAPAVLLSGCTSAFFYPSRALFSSPEKHGIKFETVKFPSTDGTELTGMFLFASSAPAKGTVVHFHGNAENMTSHFGYSAWLTQHGYNVFAFDYRGYGASQGKPSQSGVVQDGIAALAYVRRRPDVDPWRVAVFGQSLGGAVAAASVGLSPAGAAQALVIESSFDSYKRIAQDALSRSWLTWPLQWLARFLISDRHRPTRYAERLAGVPIVVVHGDEDRIVPLYLGGRLFDGLAEPKQFWLVPGGRHCEAFTRFGRDFRPRLDGFLSAAFKRRAQSAEPKAQDPQIPGGQPR